MKAPKELRVSKDRRSLTVVLPEDGTFVFEAEFLRVLSPSAEVQGHAPDQRVTVHGKKNVAIERLEPVGNYAVRIIFDDGHQTGLYSWRYLAELGREKEERWQDYVAELTEKGLSRER